MCSLRNDRISFGKEPHQKRALFHKESGNFGGLKRDLAIAGVNASLPPHVKCNDV